MVHLKCNYFRREMTFIDYIIINIAFMILLILQILHNHTKFSKTFHI